MGNPVFNSSTKFHDSKIVSIWGTDVNGVLTLMSDLQNLLELYNSRIE